MAPQFAWYPHFDEQGLSAEESIVWKPRTRHENPFPTITRFLHFVGGLYGLLIACEVLLAACYLATSEAWSPSVVLVLPFVLLRAAWSSSLSVAVAITLALMYWAWLLLLAGTHIWRSFEAALSAVNDNFVNSSLRYVPGRVLRHWSIKYLVLVASLLALWSSALPVHKGTGCPIDPRLPWEDDGCRPPTDLIFGYRLFQWQWASQPTWEVRFAAVQDELDRDTRTPLQKLKDLPPMEKPWDLMTAADKATLTKQELRRKERSFAEHMALEGYKIPPRDAHGNSLWYPRDRDGRIIKGGDPTLLEIPSPAPTAGPVAARDSILAGEMEGWTAQLSLRECVWNALLVGILGTLLMAVQMRAHVPGQQSGAEVDEAEVDLNYD